MSDLPEAPDPSTGGLTRRTRARGLVRRVAAEAVTAAPYAVWAAGRVLLIALAGLGSLLIVALGVVRFVDPPGSMLMLAQRLSGGPVVQTWVPLEAISPHLIRAVVASEDSRFCSHGGIDLNELAEAIEKAEDTGDDIVRGASTISMQVVKNLFLWPGKSYLRKGLEIAITLPMEAMLPKSRIAEIYLNIAEWGPGVFGAEAAARHHFRKPAARLTAREAALLAVTLPNPIARTAGRPGPQTQRLAGIIERRMQAVGAATTCLLPRGGVR